VSPDRTDETTVCKFRHLLEEHQLGEQILGTVNLHLQAQGVRITTGTIVDATILHAPTSTKNREQQRDPEMHQTKKGKQWYFGMKAHAGVDRKTKIIHTALATAANVADSAVLPDLLHGEETRVGSDQAYSGQSEGSGSAHRRLRTVPIGATATRIVLMKWSGRRTGPSRGCARKWSTCLR
jgi:IS5 family transposase